MRYRTIVVDPPWDYTDGWGRGGAQGIKAATRRGATPLKTRKPLDYPSMNLVEIRTLPIADLADPDGCHVYLWTTNRYLRDSFSVLDAWGIRFGQLLVWAKTPMGLGPGGTFAQSSEYVLFGRRGSLNHLQRIDSTWFNWPRMDRQHSRKPDGFLDIVEMVSPAPRLEMFARRNRLGWDTWGNECFEHVDLAEDRP